VVAAASILARAAFVEGIKKLGDEIGSELPKGASARVIETGKRLLRLRGPEIFQKISKTHFKTLKDLSPSS
jgi:ribonuclease HIII